MYKIKYYYQNFCLLIFLFALLSLPVKAEEDTLEKIKQRGVILWGNDAESGAPYCFYNPENPSELIGFEVDMMKLIGRELKVKDKMVQNDWDALVPGLKRGNFDIAIGGIEITEAKKQEISFTNSYYAYDEQIAVRKEENNINKLSDLKGKKVGTLSGSAALRILTGAENIDYKIYSSIVGSYTDLANGRLDAVLLDLPIATFYAKPHKKLKLAGEPFGGGYYGICVRKEDVKLLEEMNKIIFKLLKSGELEQIYRKWDIWTDKQKTILEYKDDKKTEIKKKTTLDRISKELPLLLKGAVMTLKICFLSMTFAVILGLSIAIIRIYAPKPFGFLAAAYVEVMRGTPLLIQLYIIYYGLPEMGIRLEAFTAAILGLSLNYAAYESENYRAGINSIPKGQMEAALALGMTKNMALRRIIIPQAVRVVIPPVTNDFIAMFKDSSIVSIITMVELTKQYNYLASISYDYIGLGLMTAAIYFCMSYPASLFARAIERKLQTMR